MLDIQFIRDHSDQVKVAAKAKKSDVDIDLLLVKDQEYLSLKKELEELRSLKNDINSLIQEAKDEAERTEIITKGKEIKTKIDEAEPKFREAFEAYEALLLAVPNVPTEDTPLGEDESGNQVVRSWGEKPSFAFEPKDHMEIGRLLGGIESERAAKVPGSRFAYLMGDVALLQLALVHFVFRILGDKTLLGEIASKAGVTFVGEAFIPVIPPVFVRPEVLAKMDRLEPREDRYFLEQDNLFLTGSAEHVLGALHMDQIFEESELPSRYVGYATAFRREAGSYGKDTHGIIRMHQFDKLEMESFTLSEDGLNEQNLFVAIQEYILQALELPYQAIAVCTGDMGKPDARQIDLETWMPGQDRYRETHTSDFMGDYQARRLQTRVRRGNGKIEFVHMNDATAIAVGRMLVAILENYQEADGSVRVPKVLQETLGKERIAPKG